MIYPANYEKKIGFDTVRAEIMKLCSGELGRRAAERDLQFSKSYDIVTDRLAKADEMMRLVSGETEFALGPIVDIAQAIASIRAQGSSIAASDLLDIRSNLATVNELIAFFAHRSEEDGTSPFPKLKGIVDLLTPVPEILTLIDRTIDRFGEVRDSASPELREIRQTIRQTTASLSSVMRRVMARAVENGYLEADASAVVRDGRLVLPVSPMNKRKINGIVHDESASGKTVFIEPAELVEANNRIRELQMEEMREIVRILREVADFIRPDADLLLANAETLGIFDFIHAKALYAIQIDATLPNISRNSEVDWYHAEHPVLRASLMAHGKEIVPLDIRLTDKERILIISGPNAGGKSVCLKTVGIVQYMTQCGLLPPVYSNSHIGIFDNIFIDIGDDQSIEDDLSTYSSHLRNMKMFLANASPRTLILIDEFGGGTEPLIGGAIAQAVLKDLNERNAFGVITTHYQNLKTFAEDTPGLINGSMLYDRHLMKPLFRLSIGNPGSSFAIEIARKTGLPANIIADAEEIAGSDYVKMDRYLLDIARDKRYWENKREGIKQKEKRLEGVLTQYESDADSLRVKRREIIKEAQAEALRIIAESNAQVERTIREIREVQADKERTKEIRARLAQAKAELEAAAETDAPDSLPKLPKNRRKRQQPKQQPVAAKSVELKVGDNVKLEGQSTVGTIVELSGKKATVNFGAMKATVDVKRLKPTMSKPTSGAKDASFVSRQTTDASRERQLNFSREIDVRGMRVDEALQAVTYFVDDAVQFQVDRIRILHGTGTGALRQAIREFLATVPDVRSARDEDVRFGGAGITVVELH